MEILGRHQSSTGDLLRANAREGAALEEEAHEQKILLGDVLVSHSVNSAGRSLPTKNISFPLLYQ